MSLLESICMMLYAAENGFRRLPYAHVPIVPIVFFVAEIAGAKKLQLKYVKADAIVIGKDDKTFI